VFKKDEFPKIMNNLLIEEEVTESEIEKESYKSVLSKKGYLQKKRD